MSLAVTILGAMGTERSPRGSQGVMNELRVRAGAAPTDPLAGMTLQERRMAHIQRERPVAYTILAATWPMAQLRNSNTGNSRVRARLLDLVARKLQREGSPPQGFDMSRFTALGEMENYIEWELDQATEQIQNDLQEAADEEIEMDIDDARRHVEVAYDTALDNAEGEEDRLNDNVNEEREEEWYERHECHQAVYVSWETPGRTVRTGLLMGMGRSEDPTAYYIEQGPEGISDPHGTMPPWMRAWIEREGVDSERLHECAMDVVEWGADGIQVVDSHLDLDKDVEWIKAHFPDVDIPQVDDDDDLAEWATTWHEDHATEHNLWNEVADMAACLAAENADLDHVVQRLSDAFLVLIDWRTANPDENIEEGYSLMGLLRHALQGHINDMVIQATDEILADLETPGPVSEEKARLMAEQEVEIATFSDGAKIVEITGLTALSSEGTKMHHCIGQPRHGHPGMLRDGTVRVFSYRDPSGKPKATWEAFATDEMDTSDLQGPHNGPIHDSDARDRMAWLIWKMTIELGIVPGHEYSDGFSKHEISKLQLNVDMPFRHTAHRVQADIVSFELKSDKDEGSEE